MILPASDAINLGLVAPASECFHQSFPQMCQQQAFLNSTAGRSWGWQNVHEPATAAKVSNTEFAANMQQCVPRLQAQESSVGSAPSFQPETSDMVPRSQMHNCAPQLQAQVLESSFDAKSNTSQILWHADTRKLQSNDRSLVSPGFELPCGHFKLMISAKGNGFAKSRGMGFVKVKCESDLRGVSANLTFRITVGNDVHGPFSNDFSSQATSAPQQQALRLLSAADPSTKTVPICLEVVRTGEVPHPSENSQAGQLHASENFTAAVIEHSDAPVLALSDCVAGMAAEALLPEEQVARTRCRSSAGQQRQFLRHQARLEARSKRCLANNGSTPSS